MYDDSLSNIYEDSQVSKKSIKNSNWIIISLVIITIIISYFVLFKDLFKNKNIKKEEEMIKVAKDYVLQNNISTTREIYLDVSKINVSVDDNCNLTSGVIYDGSIYQANLVCDTYQSKVVKSNDDVSDYIKLKGDEVVILAKGMTYFEPGYESNDIVTIIGNVGSEEGVYNLYYKTTNSNSVAIRKVIIIDNQVVRNLFPIITLNGDEVNYLIAGNEYIELGINGYDTIDGNISGNVVIDNNIDINKIGEYIVSYTLVNSRGYTNTTTRKINVISKDTDLLVDYTLEPRNLTNEDVLINLNISNEYNKIIYPDGREGKELNYLVSENGNYKFTIYDKYNRITEKEIIIDNIDKTIPQGSCIATRFYNRTEIKVTIDTEREISSYEYIVNSTSSVSSQSNYYVSNIVKPTSVKVNIKDIINNQNEINCSLEDNLTRNIVTDSKGKNCLEGYQCYVQFDYGSRQYPYCSMSNNPNSCGGIGRNGCSITSASNAIAAMGIKSKNGTIHTPFTVWDELYPINKKTGECGGGCSAWTRIRDAVVNAGLTAPRRVAKVNKNNIPEMLEHLRKGYPIIVWSDTGAFTKGRHYMAILAVREDNYVFLSDSANTSGTKKSVFNGKQYYVDTWIPTDDLITGLVKEYLLVGPPGMFEGK